MMLTLEQVQLGRSYLADPDDTNLETWLLANAEALLDAAERVARDAERLRANELTAEEISRGARAWGFVCNDDDPAAEKEWTSWSDRLERVFGFALETARDTEAVGKPRPVPVEAKPACNHCGERAHLKTISGEVFFFCTYDHANQYAIRYGKRFSLVPFV
jgi:hypothetical protein